MSKRTIISILLSCSSLVFVACDPVEGDLIVQENFTVKRLIESNCADSGSPCWNQDEKAEITADRYTMKMDTESHNRLIINISKSWNTTRLELTLPEGKRLPNNGDLNLSANESGQPFDFKISMQTTVTDSETHRGNESCTERVQTEVCHIVPGTNAGGAPAQKCEMKTVAAKGEKYVEYYFRNVSEKAESLFLKENSSIVVGVYKGSRHNSNKIYTRTDRCELYRPYVYDLK